ncbi:hypothetical protein [Micromonospora sp. DPT]|uniref:hypothetical protein n=1 Tax=Micromonospora sp. DPT TaxID=3142975 RepID=UPI003209DDAE
MLAGLGWLCLGCVPLVLDSLTAIEDRRYYGTMVFAVLALFFGIWVFWRDGGPRITVVGTYNLGFALFVGFAAAYHALRETSPELPLFRAVTLCYFVHVLTWLLFWSAPSARPATSPVLRVDPAVSRWAVRWGLALLTLAVLLQLSLPEQDKHIIINAAGFVGVVLLSVGLLRTPLRKPPLVYGLVPVAGFAVYCTFLFDGFGRIVVGSLGLALAAVLIDRSGRGRHVKVAILALTPVAVLVLARIRAAAPVESVVDNANRDIDGLYSVVWPLRDFAQLLSMNDLGVLPRAWGGTFYAAAVFLVPRAVWPDKPLGLGAELVPFLSPEMVGTNQSDAALFFGEWLFNFGVVGLALMIPAAGLAIQYLDRLARRITSVPLMTPRTVLAYVTGIVLTVGFFDVIWVGAATFAGRTGCRLLVLAALLLIIPKGAAAQRTTAVPHRPGGAGVHAERLLPAAAGMSSSAPGRQDPAVGRPPHGGG